jgi:hypothetical protein
MSIPRIVREQVRHRAHCACEFCGVSEIDTGGLLTIDHFQPRSKGGTDDVENLIYACAPCNQYKNDYWASEAADQPLWNPRQDPAHQHFVELDDGQLTPLTPTGIFTIRRLRLNRSQLVAARQRSNQRMQTELILQRYQELTLLQNQITEQITRLAIEQQVLLTEQQQWLRMLLRRR